MQRYNSKAFELETSQKRANTNDNNYNIDDTKKVVFAKGGKQRVKPCPGWRVFWHTSTHCNIVLLYWKIAKLSSKGKTVFKFLKWGTWGSRAKVAIYQHSNLHQAWASPSPFCHMYLINIQINKGRIIYNNNLTFWSTRCVEDVWLLQVRYLTLIIKSTVSLVPRVVPKLPYTPAVGHHESLCLAVPSASWWSG